MSRFWHALIAVLVGNAVYFLLLYPLLPLAARHQPYRLDWGLVVDFWVCLFVWGLIATLLRLRSRKP